MSTEDYVSLEVAKLLKEKGYCWPCNSFYTLEGLIKFRTIADNFNRLTAYSRPALYEAQKWLREKYNIHLCIKILRFYKPTQRADYICDILSLNTRQFKETRIYNSYEEALNAGVFEALNLI